MVSRVHFLRAALTLGLGGCQFSSAGTGTAADAASSTGGQDTTSGTQAAETTLGGGTTGSSGGAVVDGSTSRPPDPDTSAGTTGSTGSTGETGADSTGAPPLLHDCGLLSRHYLDEAASGNTPSLALDAGPNGLDLDLDYGGGNMAYAEVAGHRGLSWAQAGGSGVAATPIEGTAFAGLDTQTMATVEVVVELGAVDSNGSRLVHIGGGSEGGVFTLASDLADELHFRFNGVERGDWPMDFAARGRTVVHAVVDTAQPTDADRIRLYVDGVRVVGLGSFPGQFAALAIDPVGRHFALGNRLIGGRSFVGTLFYAATYGCALTDQEIADNVAILELDDDTP
jgi:hypothetical protein